MTSNNRNTSLVTGASRGIGRATALALAVAGDHVLVHYGNSKAEAETLVREIQERGGEATALQADLAASDGPERLTDQVRSIVAAGLRNVVLNAGVSKVGPLEDYTVQDFDRLFSTNVRAPFFVLQQLLPLLKEGSSVTVVTSVVAGAVPGNPGQEGVPTLPLYAATKGALETLVKHWAAILGPRGIRVNAVSPGVIETDMSSSTRGEAGRRIALDAQALKRVGQPSDVAEVIAFLASGGARWITGASIPVDGGTKR